MARYHHGDLRNALIEAGRALIAAHGPEAFTLRQVAREVGVSHTASYRHFADKEALLAAIAQQGFVDLVDAVARAQADASDPLAALARSGRAYVAFAVAHPAAFRVMFRHWAEPPEDLDRAGQAAFQQLLDAVVAAQEDGAVRAGEPRELALAAWSGVHGLARLLVDNALPPVLQERPPDLERVGELLLVGVVA